MKNLAKLNGAKALSKTEQKSVNGGKDTNWCDTQPNGTNCGGTGGIGCFLCHQGSCLPYNHPVFPFPDTSNCNF